MSTTTVEGTPTTQERGKALLVHAAGYIGHRTIAIGLRSGLIPAVAAMPGATAGDLAETLELDDLYVFVWCRAALGAGVLEREGDGFRLASHVDTLLLDVTSPAYLGGVFSVLEQPEVFDRFERHLASGERMWWDDTSPEWIAEVAGTGTPFYTRLVPGGLDRVPGLAERLSAGCRVIDTACGSGSGVVLLARCYPACYVVGVDGDPHSIERAAERADEAGVADRVTLVGSDLEHMRLDETVTLVVNNISMHECRDIDQVTDNVKAILEPGGWFVISDFPFPDTDDGLRSIAGRVMSGIQFFEAQIDDQLLPRAAYDDLLTRHGFRDLGSFELSPVHAVTYART